MSEQRPTDRSVASEGRPDVDAFQANGHTVADGTVGAAHPHFALFYESRDELFASAIPFIQEGLDQGEHCWYIVDDTTEATVREAMTASGIDVEAACAAGDLAFYSTDEASVEAGGFVPEAMIETWAERAREAIDQDGYEGVRIASEATWELATSGDDLIDGVRDYECQLNDLFAHEDCRGLCMYNRERFPPETLEDIITHHPQVIYDETVAQNVYYTPPAKDSPSQRVDRQLQTLVARSGPDAPMARDDSTERTETEEELRESKEQLEADLAAMRELQDISTRLIQEGDIDALYEEILDAAVTIMDADCASVQLLDADRDELELLAHRGFDPAAAQFWQTVGRKESTTCGKALDTGERVVVPDIEQAAFIAGTEDHEIFRQTGINAVQTTPLISRNGEILGMISTHWETAHDPSEHDLRLLDVLARQAADLIEHRQTEDKLRTAEERQRLALDASEMGIWEIDLQSDAPAVRSPRHDAIFGYEETVEDWYFEEDSLDHVHPDDQKRVAAGFEEALETGDWETECRIIRADGEHRWITTHAEVDYEEGEPARLIGTIQDITERKDAENTQQRLAAIVESSDDAIISKDLNGVIQTWNSTAEQLFGYTTQEAVGQPITMLFPPERVEEEDEILRRLRQGERIDHYETVRRRKDGELLDISLTISPITDAHGRIIGASKIARNITERKEREQQLARQREQIAELKDRLLETSPTGILVVDASGDIMLANERAAAILGRSREDLISINSNISKFEFVGPAGEPLADADDPFEEVRTTGDPRFGREVGLTRSDGQRVWLSVNAAPLYDDQADEMTETVVALEDITDHKQLNAALEQLNDASRELMATDTGTITDQAADIAHDVLDVDYTALWYYDSEAGDLQHQTTSTVADVDPDAIRYPDGFAERAWQVFISDDSDVSNDLPPADDVAPAESPLRSCVIVPLGRHGIICAGTIQPNMFDDATVDLAETVAANIEAALDRADREQQLEAQNTELTQLNQINDIIREINQGLVQAETREEIDRLVCECFADSERYEFAWIGATEPGADTVTPREWADVDPGYLEDLEITTDETRTGQGPVGTALRTREPQVVEDIVTDARFDPWREQTLVQDVRSCISVALCYEDSLYGVLTVYAAQPLDDTGYEVLAELGETIGHAINAVETKRTLQTDSVVELSLQLREPDTVLASLAQQAACTIEFEGLVPHADDAPTIFFRAHGASFDDIHRHSTDAISIASVTCLSEQDDSCLCKARIGGTTLASAFIAEEAVIRSLTIEETTVSAVVDLAQAGEVRSFVECIQSEFPSTDLGARRTRERSLASEQDLQTGIVDHLTDRQQEVLRTAYLSGFFEMPRESTGQEIAGFLDVSQPTFTQHLRRGQHTIFELLFDDG